MEKRKERIKWDSIKDFSIKVIALLMLFPLAPFINRFIPPIIFEEWNMDLIISFVIAGLLIRLLMWVFKPLLFPAFVLMFGYLIYGSITHGYGFEHVYRDYKATVMGNWITKDEKQLDILNIDPDSFNIYASKTARTIKKKLNDNDSLVRNFSVQHSLDYFDEYYVKYKQIVRRFSLFRYINENFKYVSDAERDEYFALARETILNGLGGDCDDHSILMASALRCIGARTRIILVKGHAYPELFVGDKTDFEQFKQAIIQLFQVYNIKIIYYHEHNNEYWINLDYTAHHPGGRYIGSNVYAVIE